MTSGDRWKQRVPLSLLWSRKEVSTSQSVRDRILPPHPEVETPTLPL